MTTARTVARPSATVVLARPASPAPELLLVQRRGDASFANTWVFPGGLVDAQDHDVGTYCVGRDPDQLDAVLGAGSASVAYYSAAIREVFEEVGVLLARDNDGCWVDSAAFARYREPVHRGDIPWPDMLRNEGLTLALDALHYFSYWATPRELPRRFSTRFFVAEVPANAVARHSESELLDSRWITAAAVLNAAAAMPLPPPTRHTLESVSAFAELPDLLAWAAETECAGVSCCCPAVIETDGEQTLVMPDDPRYPDYDDDDV